jgi:hypothetical protein
LAVGAAAAIGIAAFAHGGRPSGAVMRWVAVLAVLALGAIARLAVSMDGLASADYLVRTSGTAGWERERRTAGARGRLTGAAVGVAAVAGAAGGWLAFAGVAIDHLVAVLVGLCLIVRSRLFQSALAAGSLVAAGGVVLVLGALHLVVNPPGALDALVPLAAALVMDLVLNGTAAVPDGATVAERVLYRAESSAVTAMVCTAATAMGFSDFITGLAT